MNTFNYDDRRFKVLSGSENSQTGDQTIFHYHQQGSVVWADYQGGTIVKGHLLGVVNPTTGGIEMRYHHIDREDQLWTGVCQSTPRLTDKNKIQLHESWQWTCGDHSHGTSILEEV